MDLPSPQLIQCPGCRAKNFAIDDFCTTCRGPLTVVILPRPKLRRFYLSTVMVMVAVLAICFAMIRRAPFFPAGEAVSMVLITVMLRTMLEYEWRKADGRPMQPRELARWAIEALPISPVLLPASIHYLGLVFAFSSGGPFPFVSPMADGPWYAQATYVMVMLIGIGLNYLLARGHWRRTD